MLKYRVPFNYRDWITTKLDPVAFLGFLGSIFVSKVRDWSDVRGVLDGDVARLFTTSDSPLKELVSDRQSSSSESDILPPAQGQVLHWEGEW